MAKSIARNLADVASPTGVLDGTLSTAAQTNITSVGTLSSLTVSGNLNATLTTAAQTNITSLGTLSSLNLSGALTGTTGTFTTADNLTQVKLISTDADAGIGPRLDLFRNSASPAAGDFIGRVRFLGEDSAGNETAYVHFDSLIVDPTDGSEDGQLRIETKTNGTMQNRIGIDNNETVINQDHADVDFRVETDNKTHMLFVDSSTNRVGINTSSPDLLLHIEDSVDGEVSAKVVNSNSGSSAFAGLFLQGDGNNFKIKNWGDGTSNANATEFNSTAGSSHFIFSPGNSEAMRINSDGTVDFTNHIDLPDSKYVRLGNDADMIIYHDGTSSYVQSAKQDADIYFRGNDGGTAINAMYLDMSAGGVGRMLNGIRPQTDGVGALGSSSLRWSGLHVKSTEHEGITFAVESTTANAFRTGFRIDMDVSGSDTLTADRAQYGQYITLDSSATGGDTSDEHRLYGLRSSTKATGDSDLIYGGYFTGEAEHSAGQVSALYGSYSQASADPESGGTISNVYGAWNTATLYGSSGSTVQNAYASYNRILLGTTDVIAHNTIHGVMAEIETDASGTARTTASGYLFRGLFDDDSSAEHKFTNFYGLHLSGTDLSNRVDGTGNVAGVYLDMPGVDQGFWNSEDQPNYFRGSLSIGSGGRQVGDTVGAELHLVEPDGGELVLARYDSTIGSNNSLGKVLFGGTEDSGTTVNFSASIQAFAQSAHSTTDADGYLSFYTTPQSSTTLTERMRIKSDGTVGIGTDAPLNVLDTAFTASAHTSGISITNKQTGGWGSTLAFNSTRSDDSSIKTAARIRTEGAESWNANGTTSSTLIFETRSNNTLAERMRLSHEGDLSVGRTSTGNSATNYGIDLYHSGHLYLFVSSSGDSDAVRVYNSSGTQTAAIDADGDYMDLSDERYKENILDASSVLDTISKMKVRSFNWKEDGRKQSYGFVAQELNEVAPEAVRSAKDDEDVWAVKHARIVPMLTKAIQEQQGLIEALQAEVAALKGS